MNFYSIYLVCLYAFIYTIFSIGVYMRSQFPYGGWTAQNTASTREQTILSYWHFQRKLPIRHTQNLRISQPIPFFLTPFLGCQKLASWKGTCGTTSWVWARQSGNGSVHVGSGWSGAAHHHFDASNPQSLGLFREGVSGIKSQKNLGWYAAFSVPPRSDMENFYGQLGSVILWHWDLVGLLWTPNCDEIMTSLLAYGVVWSFAVLVHHGPRDRLFCSCFFSCSKKCSGIFAALCVGADLYLIVKTRFHYTVDIVMAIVITLLIYTNAGALTQHLPEVRNSDMFPPWGIVQSVQAYAEEIYHCYPMLSAIQRVP